MFRKTGPGASLPVTAATRPEPLEVVQTVVAPTGEACVLPLLRSLIPVSGGALAGTADGGLSAASGGPVPYGLLVREVGLGGEFLLELVDGPACLSHEPADVARHLRELARPEDNEEQEPDYDDLTTTQSSEHAL